MNTIARSATKLARVAVNVRLYFDVPVANTDKHAILRAALAELQRAEELERIRVNELRFPAIYPADDWAALELNDFEICDICPAEEAQSATKESGL